MNTMILENTEKWGFVALNLVYITISCKLPSPHVYMIDKWIKDLHFNVFDCVKKMMVSRKKFCQKPSREYETANLRTPYCLIALMLNLIFEPANGKFYKIS